MAVSNLLHFQKMHGLGNDFVIIDCRENGLVLAKEEARKIADRHIGVGCDQIILIEGPRHPSSDIRLTFFNSDGSVAGACGNGTRCAAVLILDKVERTELLIETDAGLLMASREINGLVTVDMGRPGLRWDEVPLAQAMDTLLVPLGIGELGAASCASMGNPHATFFVKDVNAVDLARIGPLIEHHPIFPERVNVGIAQIQSDGRIFLRVWERGAGETLACGSGACAAVVAAARRGLSGRKAEISLSLGSLSVEWTGDDHIMLTGPTATSFTGKIDLSRPVVSTRDSDPSDRQASERQLSGREA